MYYIGNYVGVKIKDVLSNGDFFILEGYYSEIWIYLIRLYLYILCKLIGDEDFIISEKLIVSEFRDVFSYLWFLNIKWWKWANMFLWN